MKAPRPPRGKSRRHVGEQEPGRDRPVVAGDDAREQGRKPAQRPGEDGGEHEVVGRAFAQSPALLAERGQRRAERADAVQALVVADDLDGDGVDGAEPNLALARKRGGDRKHVRATAPGVGCGAAILREGRLLLVKRLKPPEAGCWNLPGGKVEFGERAAEAARREVAEELGLDVEIGRALGFVEMILDGQHWVSPIFRAAIRSGEPFNAEPEKQAGFVWADLAAPPAPLAIAAREAIARLTD